MKYWIMLTAVSQKLSLMLSNLIRNNSASAPRHLRRSGMTRVLKGSHSFTCTPRIYLLTEWTIPSFAFPAEAGPHLLTPEGWKAELALGGWLCYIPKQTSITPLLTSSLLGFNPSFIKMTPTILCLFHTKCFNGWTAYTMPLATYCWRPTELLSTNLLIDLVSINWLVLRDHLFFISK